MQPNSALDDIRGAVAKLQVWAIGRWQWPASELELTGADVAIVALEEQRSFKKNI